MSRGQLLIVDDEEINRMILHEMFVSEDDGKEVYDVIEAADGEQAIRIIKECDNLVLILLDIIMPKKDGFSVLEYLDKNSLLEKIPVILITGASPDETEERAYSYSIADVMYKPFVPGIVKKRANNVIELYQHRRDMRLRIKEQKVIIKEQEEKIMEANEFMIDALSTVIEFRSVETGDHVRRIKYFTRILAKYLAKYFPEYGLTDEQVDQIARASALHDVGKIGIPDAVLLKPGRLTADEFEIIKTHTTIGGELLETFRGSYQEDFYQYCYDICRHHHERWDGNGYPDHLAGDDIPISAQIVSIADVYDALVSERVYKTAYSTEEAYRMILNGECGEFSPKILECFELAKEDFFNIVEVIKMFKFT